MYVRRVTNLEDHEGDLLADSNNVLNRVRITTATTA